jgi:phosphoribosylaminoimidazolecarboxamide formyltransferase / IMP cyclohydrolase
MPRALISVSDKTDVAELAAGLHGLGWEIISTGGTASLLREAGLPVMDVSEVTGHPEMMDGRVKTLHPAVHAGILARRSAATDMDALHEHGYAGIDMVVVNLYPFHEAVAAGSALSKAMDKVDIGGPTMLRAAAKNHESVLVVVDPADYTTVLSAVRDNAVDAALRHRLARRVFAHTSRYDSAIAEYFEAVGTGGADGVGVGGTLPESMGITLSRVQALRYGENPDQNAAFYREPAAPPGSLPHLQQLHGRELSFNNLLDADAAVSAISAWAGDSQAACVIIKHTTPCGVATGSDPLEAWQRALAGDPVSAFGGIVAFNTSVDPATADALSGTFLEIVIAPAFEPDALSVLTKKKNLRLISLPLTRDGGGLDFKRVNGGFLVQERMSMAFDEAGWSVATKRQPTEQELADMRFAWRVCASVKSNAIVIARDGMTIGIGAGQMSRVDSSRLAVMKASDQNADTHGAALASDAFFPFRDGIDAAAAAGVACIIQPGGSVRDDEVVAAADEHGMSMIFTGRRVFRH